MSGFGLFLKILLCLAAVSFIVLFFDFRGDRDEFSTLLSATSFIFGSFMAFSIANSQSRLNKIDETIKSDEGLLQYIYKISSLFGDEVQKDVRKLIDNYLIDQLDYYLVDFRYSGKSFNKLFDYLIHLKRYNKAQDSAYSQMMGFLQSSSVNRQKIEALVGQRVQKFEWMTILTLLSITLFFILYTNTGSNLSNFITIVVTTAFISLVLLLREIDTLRWKETTWIWDPLVELFKDLDLLPYFPEDVIKKGRYKVAKGEKIRLASYANPYPNMEDKKVETIEV